MGERHRTLWGTNEAREYNAGGSMSEQDEENEYLAKSTTAVNDAESSLSDIGEMELRRKLNTANAVIRSVCPMFYEAWSIQKELKARRESRGPLFWLTASLVVGGVLHYSFRNTSRPFDFTFGIFVAAYGFVRWLLYGFATEKMARALKDSQRTLDEMLYRWIANGSDSDRFWQLRDQADVDTGDIDLYTHRYRRWWYEMKGDLVDSINGELSRMFRRNP